MMGNPCQLIPLRVKSKNFSYDISKKDDKIIAWDKLFDSMYCNSKNEPATCKLLDTQSDK